MKNNSNITQNLKQNYKKILFVFLPIFVLLLVLDLLAKHFANNILAIGEQKNFIPGVVDFINVHNDGGAWNIFAGNQIFLIVFTSLFLIAFLFFYVFEVKNKALFHISSALIVTGCIGNLVDRIAFNYVRDMIHLVFFPSFPVFNVADICVCIGIFLLILYYVIYFIKSSKKEDVK